MNKIQHIPVAVSLFASSNRPQLYPDFFKSLEGTSVPFEVVFAGNSKPEEVLIEGLEKVNFKYIHTANIKPAQCYEIARRNCSGEAVVWVADDCEFPNNVIGQAYDYWRAQKDHHKLILSIQTKESGYGLPKGELFKMKVHRFYGGEYSVTPLMAPLGLMSREFLQELGGLDRRYVCGQYENDIVMRALVEDGRVEIFGGASCFIDIDHLGKSIKIGESKTDKDFLNRPFATGYEVDRQVLEKSWTTEPMRMSMRVVRPGVKVPQRMDKFQPYEETDLLTKSQSNKGRWE